MSYATALARAAALFSRVRQETWPVDVTLADASVVSIAKSPTKLTREANPHGTGYVQRAIATFLFPITGAFVPDIGNEWEVTVTTQAEELGTRWRCFDLARAGAGSDHRAVCFRLD